MAVSEIKKVLADLTMYLEPNLLLEEYSEKLKKGKSYKKRNAERYCDIIMNINWFLDKIGKYADYFSVFYPSNELVSNNEALEHHIHAYLEDLYSLKVRVQEYVNSLKNDLQKVAINSKEIKEELEDVSKEIQNSFSDVSKYRGPHRHKGNRFTDDDLLKGMTARTLLDSEIFKSKLTKQGVDKLEFLETEAFLKGKEFWSLSASNAYEQVSGLTETIIKGTKNALYQFLGISTVMDN